MFFSSWLRTRTPPGASEVRRTSKPARRQAAFRPRLEALEGRDVPSTLTVTNTLDTGFAGDGSLPGEIAAAQSGDTIVFDPTTMTGKQIVLTSGDELFIDKNLTIQGLPAGSVINGGGLSRVFAVRAGVSVTLTNLTITRGIDIAYSGAFDDTTVGEGAGIFNLGTLTVQNCMVTGNTGEFGGPRGGGGIYNGFVRNKAGATTLSISGSTLSGNSAGSEGGGIYNDGSQATVMNCTITGNTAGYEGGGIYNAGRLTVGGSAFSANTPDNVFGGYTNKKGNTFG